MDQTFLSERGGTFCLSKAGLAEGTNPNTIKTAAPNGAGTDYCIDGVLYHKADTDNIAMNALAQQGVLTKCLYCVQIDSAGAVSLKKGNDVLAADLAAGNAVLHWPLPDAGKCAIGFIKIALASSATFTSGSTDLSAANVTATYYDVFAVPVAPLTS
ncbi:MAG: hypothetical protein AB7N65_14200 [Vicinamibacterales bacterium]